MRRADLQGGFFTGLDNPVFCGRINVFQSEKSEEGVSRKLLFMQREEVTGCKLPYVPAAIEFPAGAAWLKKVGCAENPRYGYECLSQTGIRVVPRADSSLWDGSFFILQVKSLIFPIRKRPPDGNVLRRLP